MRFPLRFKHDCYPPLCPMAGSEFDVLVEPLDGFYIKPEVKCIWTNKELPLMAVNYNRNI